MTTTIIVIVSFIVALVAYTIGRVNSTEPLPRCCSECLHEHRHGPCPPFMFDSVCCDHYGISSLRKKMTDLEVKQMILDKQFNEIRYNTEMQSKPIYARTIPEQEIVDALIKGVKPLNELLDKMTK